MPLSNIKSNIVQSIRAFRVPELHDAAARLGHHFLCASLSEAQTKDEVISALIKQFSIASPPSHSYDAIYDSITEPFHKSGPQTGFIVVLEQIPTNPKFDREARESLLDIFRDASDYWAERKVPFRCFYSYSVARAVRPMDRGPAPIYMHKEDGAGEVMPTNKLVDVSPMALRMSSPFNAGYWLAATVEVPQEESAP